MDTNWKEIEENDAISLLTRDTNEQISIIKRKLDMLIAVIQNMQDDCARIHAKRLKRTEKKKLLERHL